MTWELLLRDQPAVFGVITWLLVAVLAAVMTHDHRAIRRQLRETLDQLALTKAHADTAARAGQQAVQKAAEAASAAAATHADQSGHALPAVVVVQAPGPGSGRTPAQPPKE